MTRLPRPLRILAWIYLAYLALALLVVLPALNFAAPWAVREFTGRELEHEILLFNPFTLAVELREATIVEPDGHEPLHLRRAEVNLSLESLWQEGVVLDLVSVEDLDVHVLRYANGSFHFDDLLATEEDSDPEEEPGEIPGVTIHRIFASAHTLRFTDRSKPGVYSAAYSDFAVETGGLSTLPARRSDGGLTLRGADGGVISWDGELALAEGHSSGRLGIENLDLVHLWRYEAENLTFITRSALLDVSLAYRVNWSEGADFDISDGRLRLHAVDLAPKDDETLTETRASLGELLVAGIAADSSTQSASIDAVSLRGLEIAGFSEGERISLLEMFGVDAGEAAGDSGQESAEENAGDAAPEAADEDVPPWTLALGEITLDESRVDWRADLLAPERLSVTPLRLEARDITWPAASPSTLALSLAVNGETTLEAGGELHLGSGDGSVRYDLRSLPLPWGNPVVNQSVRADLIDGVFSTEGQLSLSAFAPFSIESDLSIANFAAQIHGAEESALSFANFTVSGANVDMDEALVDIADIELRSLRSGLHILEDGTFNAVSALIDSEPGTETTSAEDGDGGEDSGSTTETTADDAESPEWAVRVAHVGVRDGRVDFSDASLPLPFSTLIGDIEADINDLDSRSEQPLVATLNGAVDGYAPVVIEARGTPLGEPRDASLSLSFRGMDIATMSPYSGTYAGYTIDSGTLSVDLRYGVKGSELDGDNRIVISQMQLGEPIESAKAMELPLKLGIALLTDARGVIDLDVPISGDVNDPQFSLGKVIGGAIANIIIKAATAPFRLLASLVDSEEDLENIAFAPGSAALSKDSASALATLGEALQQRPQLLLLIDGSVDPVSDKKALQRAALDRQLGAEGLAAESIAAQDETYWQAVESRYDALGIPAPDDGSEVTVQAMREELASRIALPAGTLQDLGTKRATEAKRALVVDSGIDAARIAVTYDASLLAAGVKMSLDG